MNQDQVADINNVSLGWLARVECDSISPDGIRLTTVVARYPRLIHDELLTHRMLSRNSSSLRAIPVLAQIRSISQNPYCPEEWGSNQKGMQAGLAVSEPDRCRMSWLGAKNYSVARALELADLDVHKQHANRLLVPFSWITTVITATDWANFFALRCHPAAQPEFQKIACMIRDAMVASTPRRLEHGEWHLPFIRDGDRTEIGTDIETLKRISAARCARVSYLTHEGKRDHQADLALYDRLVGEVPRHSSPLEHVATPDSQYQGRLGLINMLFGTQGKRENWMDRILYNANFKGWCQHRHEVPMESVSG